MAYLPYTMLRSLSMQDAPKEPFSQVINKIYPLACLFGLICLEILPSRLVSVGHTHIVYNHVCVQHPEK